MTPVPFHPRRRRSARLTMAAAGLASLMLGACNTIATPSPVDTAAFRLDRYEEMQRVTSFESCTQEGLALDAEARQRASTGAFLNSARVLEGCVSDVSPSAAAVPEEERMRIHALSTVNYLKGGDIAAARRSLDGFKRDHPDRDLYFGNRTSFVETTEILLGRVGEYRLGQFAALNVDNDVKREVRRVNYWKDR